MARREPRLNAFRSSRVIIRPLCRRSATTVYQYVIKSSKRIETVEHRTPLHMDPDVVGGSGKVGWSWHMESKGSGGTGTVSCTLRSQSKSATVSFAIGWAQRTQHEMREIAAVLNHETGRSIIEIWDEALRLHRVRYETGRGTIDREEKT